VADVTEYRIQSAKQEFLFPENVQISHLLVKERGDKNKKLYEYRKKTNKPPRN